MTDSIFKTIDVDKITHQFNRAEQQLKTSLQNYYSDTDLATLFHKDLILKFNFEATSLNSLVQKCKILHSMFDLAFQSEIKINSGQALDHHILGSLYFLSGILELFQPQCRTLQDMVAAKQKVDITAGLDLEIGSADNILVANSAIHDLESIQA